MEEEAREKAHTGGGVRVGWWGGVEYPAQDIEEDDSEADIKKKRKRGERRQGATAGKGCILDEHLAKWLDTVLDWKS